ncbi:MAG TPA: GH92 family glycosyl hydrolase [Actinophytocola sp.]|uniref:GH92 family glycosyl hydrolase n=1 Tax=Actinophytocola sp. TaxID=1872138 RepID=UPI002E0CAC03|nr:GH92 family glycosyl hydrolase [Actinophytocola sp.]
MTTSRKRRFASTISLAVVAALAPAIPAHAAEPTAVDDLAALVDPYTGTKPGGPDLGTGGGAGNTFPGADVPFGMVQWSPDTVTHQHGGYFYDDNRIKGFSLTHLSGAGCSTYQDLPVMPFPGEVTTSPAADPARYISRFAHTNETVSPGRYGVSLDSGARVDLSLTQRTGIGRFTFPAGATQTMLLNTSGSIAGADDAETTIGSNFIAGWVTSGRFCGADDRYRLYFRAEFDRSFASFGTWKNGAVTPGRTFEKGGSDPKVDLNKVNAPKTAARGAAASAGAPSVNAVTPMDTTVSGPGTGAFVTFDSFAADTVQLRIGLSFVSLDGARKNLKAESGNKSFDAIAIAARASWNTVLNRIKVTGGTDAERTTFYTALYHSLLQPNVFSDADGAYMGFDGRTHAAERGHAIYSNFSGWDIYRSEAQLLALIAPRETSDIARSMIAFAEQGGSWDRWTVANDYTGVMVGDPYHVIVSSAYAFGARDFDASKALLLMMRGATQPTQGYLERPGLTDYLNLGYVPMAAPDVWGPGATTLEYTSADFAIADLARRLGDGATWSTFMKRAQNWQNIFNPANASLQPRNKDGSFLEPFVPGSGEGWVEGNGAQYLWMVPYNPRGLFTALGGNAAVVPRLDTFFTELNAGTTKPFAFLGNEPNMHTPWLYNYVGAPYKTQAITRRVERELFKPGPDGLVGNDDLGQMSSMYVWSAIGMYPVIPGRAELVLNSPLFTSVVISRPGGATLNITAPAAATDAPYVTGLKVNGTTMTRTWLPESFVNNGGSVEFTLSGTPDPSWGSGTADAPPSFRDGETGQRGFVSPSRLVIPAGGSGEAAIGAQDFTGAGATVRWTASPPAGLHVTPASGEVEIPAAGKATVPVTVSVDPGAEQTTYRIPVAFTGSGGASLASATFQVLAAEPGSLRAAFNNVGTSPDDNMAVGNYDLVGFSLSANALAAAGITRGGTVVVDGISYTWPQVPVADQDNVLVAGQTVNLPDAPAGATRLAFLGGATNGRASGTLVITYTDGTTQNAQIGFSDWTLGAGGQPISFNNRIAAQTPYRNAVGGTKQMIVTYVFATAPITLDATKQVAKVTLPDSVDGGDLHVFAITAA